VPHTRQERGKIRETRETRETREIREQRVYRRDFGWRIHRGAAHQASQCGRLIEERAHLAAPGRISTGGFDARDIGAPIGGHVGQSGHRRRGDVCL
jgi:hypothetical protein